MSTIVNIIMRISYYTNKESYTGSYLRHEDSGRSLTSLAQKIPDNTMALVQYFSRGDIQTNKKLFNLSNNDNYFSCILFVPSGEMAVK